MRIHFKPASYIGSVSLILTLLIFALMYISGFDISARWKQIQKSFGKKTTKLASRTFSIAEMMGSTNVLEVVKPNINTLILKPTMPFLKGYPNPNPRTDNRRPFATIVVTSMPKSFSMRHTIRNTWYQLAEEFNIRIFFMIGFHDFDNQADIFQILAEEHKIHNDLIVDDYEEGYYKLTGKVLRMLKWFTSSYTLETAPRFFVKTDQDVFINIPNLVKSLKSTTYYSALVGLSSPARENSTDVIPDYVNLPLDANNPETYFVGGKKFENAPIESDPDSKWYIDSTEREMLNWSRDFFPTYANGPCYIFSGNVVEQVYKSSFSVPIYPFEDVYIVGLIASERLNLMISNVEELWLNGGSSLCKIKYRWKISKMVAFHPVDHPLLMKKVCKKIASCRQHLEKSKSLSIKITAASQTLAILLSSGLVLTANNFLL